MHGFYLHASFVDGMDLYLDVEFQLPKRIGYRGIFNG